MCFRWVQGVHTPARKMRTSFARGVKMTKNQEIYRKQLLARIHTHPQYKIIKDNDAWSDWLSVRFGVSSSKELSLKELNKILDILNNKCEDEIDLKPDFTGRNMIKSDKITTKQNQKIYVLANELCWDEMKLLRFVKRQIGYYVLTLKALSKKQANKVIIGLEAVIKSETKKRNNA